MKTKKSGVIRSAAIQALVIFSATSVASAQTQSQSPTSTQIVPSPTPYQIVSQDADSRLWQSTTYEQGPSGTIYPRLHQYTELASGLNYLSNGQWVASQELIEPFANGAIARQGQYQVIFANNLNSAGSIDEQTTDGKRLRSSILGLAYYDMATSNTVMIAQIHDCQGQLISDNQVLYTNAFDGVNADVRYTYEKARFEQEVILRQQPPAPEVYGLNSATTELEVYTEFIDPPEANVTQSSTTEQMDAGLEPDHRVTWGTTTLGRGHAFDMGDNGEVPVSKEYVMIAGRRILIEKVRLQTILNYLAGLPEQASLDRQLLLIASHTRSLPTPPAARKAGKPVKFARVSPAKGFVLDYTSIATSHTNFTFQGDSTYFISAAVYFTLSGTTYFEGGTVIKFTPGSSLSLSGYSSVEFDSSPYLPVVFTAKDDNTCGQPISGSTGTPSGYYANTALNLTGLDYEFILSDFKVAYAVTAISGLESGFRLQDVQICNCGTGISFSGPTGTIENGLMSNVRTNFSFATLTTVLAEHCTFNNSAYLSGIARATPTLTNCVLVNVTNVVVGISGIGAFNGFYQAKPFGIGAITNTFNPFQTVLGGACYLTNGCTFKNAGTNRIDPMLLAELPAKTTWAPLVYSNATFSVPTNFFPYVARDTNAAPDLGYHYAPLDFVFGGANAYSNVTFTAGTAVGWYNGGPGAATNGGYGISLDGTANAIFTGTATAPCIFAKNNMVQEGATGYWTNTSNLGGFVGGGGNATLATAPNVNFNFTQCYARQTEASIFRDFGDGTLLVAIANNSEFYSGAAAGYAMDFYFTNCLSVRTEMGPASAGPSLLTMRNCTFYGGQLIANRESSSTWPLVIEDCAFAGVNFANINDTSGGNTNITWVNYNSYLTADGLPAGEGSHYLTVTNYNWQSSWFGDYYLPTNSPIAAQGSTTANLVGLYHFTTQTNQIPEGNAQVDLGYHYVATDQYGNPLDTNGDGVPDYLEDANGNGIYDTGDLANWLINPYNGLSSSGAISVFTPLN